MRKFVVCGLMMMLVGCASSTERPVGIGGDTNEMKRSPCAVSGSDGDMLSWFGAGIVLARDPCPPVKLFELKTRQI